MPEKPIFIGVSSCLLGEATRYNGGHKKSSAVVESLCQRFVCVSLCPEYAVGLGVPRAAIVLTTNPSRQVRAIIQDSGVDVTNPIQRYAQDINTELQHLCGYVLKSKSPSCGISSAPIFTCDVNNSSVMPQRSDGIYATALRKQCPDLPLCEESDLLSENSMALFIDKVIRYSPMQRMPLK